MMHYADEVFWAEQSIAAFKRLRPQPDQRKAAGAGRGWWAAPDALNPFQQRAMIILGAMAGGLRHAPVDWDTVLWGADTLHVTWGDAMQLATWGDNRLTRAVLLAHDAAIRLSVLPGGENSLDLMLHQRDPLSETPICHHPALDEAISRHRAMFPAGHPVHWTPAA